ncbi:MAG: tetratricopeptide repeat protein [Wenzhouxiangellaceae bacterium]|nr:tetratricopeptide repeat protein [Wenzhouxiangellaceae bacterium]
MTRSRTDWQLLDHALNEALDRPAHEREHYLSQHLGAHPELLAAALSALDSAAAEPSVEQLVPDLLTEAAEQACDQQAARWCGRAIGAWRVLEPLGRGGMGAVFLAERADGAFDRKVALKLLPISLQSDDLVRRFTQERQIVARLQHPGIAQLLDGGTTDDGSPYLVLEYVDGLPISDYCDQHRLTVARRIELLLQVCEAVQFAHRNLVVHRDLKPDNILVDRDGRGRLLDFGIARLVEDIDNAPVTEPMLARLTPDYAAPEQFTGEPVTAATDVYALGCLAYRLLVGRVALELSGKPLTQMIEAVAHAPRPGLMELAGNAALPPGVRLGELDRDLAAILACALQREPQDRYGSAGELALDLERRRDGLPVSARSQGRGYRTSRFIRRHYKGLAVTAVAFSALLLTATTALYQAEQARTQRDEAQSVAGMLKELMHLANPDTGLGHDIDAHSILRTALDQALENRGSSPQTRVELLDTLAEALLAYELADEALRARREIHATQVERFGPEHPDSLVALRNLALALREQRRDFEASENLFRELLDIRIARLGEQHPDTAESYQDLGFLYLRYADRSHPGRTQVMDLLGRAHAIYTATLGEDHARTGRVLFDLGLATSDRALKIERMRRGIEIHERHVAPDDLQLFQHLGDLAMVLSDAGQAEEGLAMGVRALEGYQAARGELHPVSIILRNNLAGMYRDHGMFEQALATYQRVDELVRAVVPDNHLRRAFPQFGIGRSLAALGRPAEAEGHLQAAIEILEHNQSHNLIGISRIELGDCLVAQGRIAEAAREYEQALEIYLHRLGRGSTDSQVQAIQQRLAKL